MVVAKLGTRYSKKGCAMAPVKAIGLLGKSPAKYTVWVDTKGHPGDLRGKLFAGMAHM
jgi:sulfite reductase beta subunit-like hemoprotein